MGGTKVGYVPCTLHIVPHGYWMATSGCVRYAVKKTFTARCDNVFSRQFFFRSKMDMEKCLTLHRSRMKYKIVYEQWQRTLRHQRLSIRLKLQQYQKTLSGLCFFTDAARASHPELADQNVAFSRRCCCCCPVFFN